MAALTDNKDTPKFAGGATPQRVSLPVAANAIIYVGALALINATGYAVAGTSTGAAGLVAAGVAQLKADNTGGTDGAINVDLERGVFGLFNSAGADAISIADRGRYCYVVDDQTVARTSSNGNRALAGIVEDVDSDWVWVRVDGEAPTAQPGVDIFLPAAADLRTNLGYFVTADANANAALSTAGAFSIGVLMNSPNVGEMARIRVFGHARVVTDGVIAKGSLIASDANGLAKAAVLPTTDASTASATAALVGSNVMGVLLETGAASTLTACLVLHSGAVPKTNA